MMLTFGCSKSSNSSSPVTPPTPEPSIVFSIDASNASISPGSSFPVVVTLTSALPSSKGINISVTLTDQVNNTSLSQNGVITATSLKKTINIIKKKIENGEKERNTWSYSTMQHNLNNIPFQKLPIKQ